MWLFDSSLKSTLCLYIILIFAILLFLISLVILARRREGKVQEKFPVARPNQLLVSELLQKYRSRSNQPSIVFYEILSDETTGRHLIWVIMKKCGNTQPFASIEYYEGMDPVLIPVAKDISEEFFRQGMRADLIPCYGQPDTREN